MRNAHWALCAALALGTAVPAVAAPAAAPATRREIQQAYNKINAALARKDVDTALDYDTDDCEYYDKKGHLLGEGGGRQELVDLLDNVDTLKRTTAITSFAGTDTDATATVKQHIIITAANTVTGRAVRGVSDVVFRDYWVKTDDGWKRKRSRVLKGSFAIHKNF